MKKAVLIDGNNLLFRSFYATAYSGSILRNSKGFPTNALFGFINMLNKIIKEENPSYMMIAFDKGKTFRHEKYKNYKEGRSETPKELKDQFPVAKKLAAAMGIKCFEIDNYEADDIIGTFAKEVDKNEEFIATIISSDKDLLQLISDDCCVKLLKSNDYIMMNKETFFSTYGITPEKMVDLKALMGDSSDNIPGVKGIGEKTALSLLQKYSSLNGIYENIEDVKGKTKEKLENDKDNAYFSYELATIYKDVPIDTDLNKIKYNGITNEYISILEEYEFYSIIKKENIERKEEKLEYNIITDLDLSDKNEYSLYLETCGSYHDKRIIGLALYDGTNAYFVEKENIKNIKIFNNSSKKYTYDLKKLLVTLKYLNINFDKNFEDIMLISYLLNYNIKDDIENLMNIFNESVSDTSKLYKDYENNKDEIIANAVKKAVFIYNKKDSILEELKNKDMLELYEKIELPVSYVLADMEYTGINVSKEILNDMKEEIQIKLDILSNEIYNMAGCEFNILSPKQLGKILFEKLEIPYPKRIKDNNYSTSIDILNKVKDYPIVNKVLDYRTLSKLYSNYSVGLIDSIKEDGKIHTTFNQTLTRTGRLSSTNPNLQNIPAREEYGRLVRKAFLPSKNSVLISSDYSQIELRVFAHMSNAENLISAFKSGLDIHTKTAMDIYHVDKIHVTPLMRRNAKAVNFGILYGISSFGLSEDLGINVYEAKKFIDDYLNTYPGIKDYMNKEVEEAKEKGYVKTLFGRVRVIDEIKSNNFMIRQQGERMALNTPIQGTSADILKKAMVEIYEKFNELNLKSKIILQVHDELIIDAPYEEKEIAKKVIKDIMENTYKLNVPLEVSISEGNNWYEAK